MRTPGEMDDIDDLGLEPLTGERPHSAIGDRLMVGLAVLVLGGGLAIGAGNVVGQLVPDDSATAPSDVAATATARPSRPPPPTPEALREVTVTPGVPSDPVEAPIFPEPFFGWIQAETMLVVRSTPSHGGRQAGRLAPGEVAMVEESIESAEQEGGWMRIVVPEGLPGWVATRDRDSRLLVETYPLPGTWWPGQVLSLAAGEDEFVAVASTAAGQRLGPASLFGVTSSDGRSWQPATGLDLGFGGGAQVAWGGRGWLAASVAGVPGGVGVWIWESSDGSSWAPVGRLDGVSGDPTLLAASEAGYLLALRGEGQTFWFSRDGILWQESPDPLGRDDTGMSGEPWDANPVSIAAGPTGFFAFGHVHVDGRIRPTVAYAPNGRAWSRWQLEEELSVLHIVPVGHRVVALGLDTSGSVAVYEALADDRELRRSPLQEAAFDGAVVTAATSTGSSVIALGYERGTDRLLAWRDDGAGAWTAIAAPPESPGGFPRQVVGGPLGVVAVAYREVGGQPTPVLWHLGADGTWRPEADPVVELPDDSVLACPQLPASSLQFAATDPGLAPGCFGDAPITFTAWSVDCEECWGTGGGAAQPAWLMAPEKVLLLSPMETGAGWWQEAIPHQDLGWDERWVGRWLEVTGHFADRAAQDCRWEPSAGDELWYVGRAAVVAECERRFVVTSVELADGP